MLFSISIPVYNTDKYLDDCIKSVLNQETNNFEIILVNDGSTDRSLEICKAYQKKYNNVILFSQPNSGASGARNSGISLAQGEYIFFLDSDDKMFPGMLSKVQKIISNSNMDLIIGKYSYLSENNKVKLDNYTFDYKNSHNIYSFIEYCINNNIQIPWNPYQYFIKRKIIQKNKIIFNSKIKVAEDCDFFFSFLKFIKNFKVTNLIFIEYRFNIPGSLIKKQNSANVISQVKVFYELSYRFINKPIIHYFFVNKTISIFILITAINDIKDREKCYKIAARYINIFEEKINPKYYPLKLLINLLGFKKACGIYYKIKRKIQR